MSTWRTVALIFFIPFCLLAEAPSSINPSEGSPWFTGHLLAPSASTNEKGVVSWQPYLFVIDVFGEYNSKWDRRSIENTWTFQPYVDITYGLTDFMDIEADFAFSYTVSDGASSTRLNDSNLFLGFQALRDTPNTAIPDLRITIQEIFPFGQYDRLDPGNNGTDGIGQGSFQTGINFNFSKLFPLGGEQFFSLVWSVGYLFPLPVHIEGESVYGGVSETNGRIFPGQTFVAYLAGEYTITKNWVLAFDFQYLLTRHDRFTGHRGFTSTGEKATIGNPISQQISLAPAVEYNYSENFGLIGGVWFTLAGKNADQFLGGIFSMVISY